MLIIRIASSTPACLRFLKFSLFLALAAAAVSPAARAQTPACTKFQDSIKKGPASLKLKRFFEAQWAYDMTEHPEGATYAGYPGQNDRWTDLSMEAHERRHRELQCQIAALKKIPRASLSDQDAVSWDLSLYGMELANEAYPFGGHLLLIDQMGGMQINLPDMMFSMPKVTLADYENMLARLKKVPVLEQQTEELLREGLKRKITPVKMFLQKVPAQFDKVLTAKPEDSPLFEAFKEKSPLSEAEQKRIQAEALKTIEQDVYPALRRLRDFLVTTYIPGARESIAWTDMPNGKAWYAFEVRSQTTTRKTPKELHELGLHEVERIKTEMEKIKTRVNFKGDLKAFHKFLLTDPQFYYTNAKDLLTGYREFAKRVDPELPKIFGRLPRLPYGVREMPAYKAAEAPTAYYMGGSMKGARAGYFEANTHDLKARPKWGMEALTLHEAVPGHHLQIALAQEMEDLPEFRKNGGDSTAFVEGWGLYAESLGEDMGFYQDPYSKYGQLVYEMWRAVRLVVDTGMHEMGWSRQKALDYFMELLPKSRLESEVEIDRYITMPGQALAYKVGQLKFIELREKARRELGPKFNIRDFHDEVLRHGALPMDVLDRLFNDWLKARKKS